MGTAFGAGSHISVISTVVAGVYNLIASVDGFGVVVVSRQTMGCVGGTRSIDAGQVSELLEHVSRAFHVRIGVLTPSVTQLPPTSTLPNQSGLKIDEAAKLPA